MVKLYNPEFKRVTPDEWTEFLNNMPNFELLAGFNFPESFLRNRYQELKEYEMYHLVQTQYWSYIHLEILSQGLWFGPVQEQMLIDLCLYDLGYRIFSSQDYDQETFKNWLAERRQCESTNSN
jgi:hypothetical protein